MENQTKEGMLQYISESIEKYGSFYIGELGLEGEPIVGRIGDYAALANTFYGTSCVCELWFCGDDEPTLSEVFVDYSSMDISYLENVKTAVDRWVEIKTK
jgi:hypothetical protein